MITITDNKKKKKKRENRTFHLMLLPAVIFTAIFCYLPMCGVVIAFQDFNVAAGFFGEQIWIGWENFKFLFGLPDFWQVVFNTVYMSVFKIVIGQVVAIIVAILLSEIKSVKFKKFSQTAIYLPYFLSWVVLAGIFADMLSPSNGIVNVLLTKLGLEPIYFLGDKTWFPITMIITDVWKGFGYGTIVYLAAITNIPSDLYESASIDGASRWQKIWHITLPGMRMIIVLMALLNLGGILGANFDQIFNMYSPQVYATGDVLDTLIYRLGLVNLQFGVSTAAGLVKSGVSMFLISTGYYLAYKFADYKIF
ncbi:MAG: sugar ABC transporter permease [Tyzzerella sp.]|nr:sugar ABC transporter permease [Tyzzerella sp.]